MQQEISYTLSMLAGLLTFFSPCVLPLIPSYLGYLAGDYSLKELQQQKNGSDPSLIISAFIFTAGFSLVFTLLGLTATWLGQQLMVYQQTISRVGGIIVIVFGLHMLGIFSLGIFSRGMDIPGFAGFSRWPRAFLLGSIIGLAWTPCVGPVLGSILIYAGTAGTVTSGAIMLGFYSLGLSIPFLASAIFLNKFLNKSGKVRRYLPTVKKISGLLLIFIGLIIFTGHFTLLSQHLNDLLPRILPELSP